MKKFGLYIVCHSRELYPNTDWNKWLVIDGNNRCYGTFDSEDLAIILAKGSEKRDLKQLDKEIEKILTTN